MLGMTRPRFLMAVFFAALWQFLGQRGLEPSAPAKFGLALAQMGLANLVLVWGDTRTEGLFAALRADTLDRWVAANPSSAQRLR